MKKLMAVALLGLAFNAMASNWVTVSKSPSTVMEIESESMKKEGPTVTVWERFRYSSPIKLADSPAAKDSQQPPKYFDTFLTKITINCHADTVDIHAVRFSLKGETVGSANAESTNLIEPDTPVSTTERYVCR